MSLRRNALWSFAGLGFPLLVGASVIPYLLRHAGVEAVGILTLVWALIGYFSLFDLGLGRALTLQVAQKLATRATQEVPVLAKSGLLLSMAMGIVGGIVLALSAEALASNVFKVSEALRHDVFIVLLLAAIGVPITTATAGLRGVLEAYEDFKGISVLRMLLGIANFGLPALTVLCWGPSLVLMVASLTLSRLIIGMAHWVLVCRKLGVDLSRVPFERRHLRKLLSFGAWLTVSNVVSPLMVMADRFVISAILGTAVVAYYTVPSEVFSRVLIVPGALTAALFPRFTSLLTTDIPAARLLYRRCVILVAAFLLPVCIVAASGAHWTLTLWLGAGFADQAAPIVSILALGLALNGVAFVPSAAVQAAGFAHATAKLHVVEALLYFPLLIGGLHIFGLLGAALAWTVRVSIDFALLIWLAHRLVFRDLRSTALRHNFTSLEP